MICNKVPDLLLLLLLASSTLQAPSNPTQREAWLTALSEPSFNG
jgi:hypothetical protein